MGLRETREVINGAVVVRYNGNNPKGAGSRGGEGRVQKNFKKKSEKITEWRKKKAEKEITQVIQIYRRVTYGRPE